MIVIFMGPPGSGKGTQAQNICKELGLSHLATGNILREEVAAGSDIGGHVKHCLEEGCFPPDNLILDVFQSALRRLGSDSLLLDGIPRTLSQAERLDKIFSDLGRQIDCVIEFKLSEDVLLERVLGRYACEKCGATYHKKFHPTKIDGMCDFCGETAFSVRPDDTEEVLKKRLEIYSLETQPILSYYNLKGKLYSIDANESPSKVTKHLMDLIKKKSDRGD